MRGTMSPDPKVTKLKHLVDGGGEVGRRLEETRFKKLTEMKTMPRKFETGSMRSDGQNGVPVPRKGRHGCVPGL